MPTYIEKCDGFPNHPHAMHTHATLEGSTNIFYGTPGIGDRPGYPRLRTAWGDERLFSKNPPATQPCTIASHLGTPHTHSINGLWGSLDAGPGYLRKAHPDGSWVVYSKTAASHSVTPQREVHLCEDPTHGGGPAWQEPTLPNIHTHSAAGWGEPTARELRTSPRVKDENGEDMLFSSDPTQVTVEFTEPEPTKPEPVVHECTFNHHCERPHRHSRVNTDPEDIGMWMDGSLGATTRWTGMRPGQHLVVDTEADGSEKRFGKGGHVTAQPVVHTVERCQWLSQHPSAPHHHMRRAGESDRYRFWLTLGSMVPTSYAYEMEEWPDGSRVVFGGTRFVGDPVGAPVSEWEDGGPSE
jgi:hypothetical protein